MAAIILAIIMFVLAGFTFKEHAVGVAIELVLLGLFFLEIVIGDWLGYYTDTLGRIHFVTLIVFLIVGAFVVPDCLFDNALTKGGKI